MRLKQAPRLDPYYSSKLVPRSKDNIVATFTTILYLFLATQAYAFFVLFWWSNGDSNPGPPACKAGALAN
jgi:hypothetical protein